MDYYHMRGRARTMVTYLYYRKTFKITPFQCLKRSVLVAIVRHRDALSDLRIKLSWRSYFSRFCSHRFRRSSRHWR